ncbi:MAG: M24 family metallopeptidase [Actinomycetota bacterium]
MNTYIKRIKKLKEAMAGKSYGTFLIFKQENIYYLTGFRGKGSGSILVVGDKKNYLLVHFIYLLEAKKSLKTDTEIVEYRRDKYKSLSPLLDSAGGNKLGVEDSLAYSDFKKIDSILSSKGKKLSAEPDMVEKLRMIKDSGEIENIRQACGITDDVYRWLLEADTSFLFNLTEAELALEMEKKILSLGGDGKSFDMVVANKQGSAFPHYVPGKKKIGPGAVLVDFGVMFNNYCSDITRTFFAGLKNIGQFKKIYDIVLEAQNMAVESCREGISSKELDSVARKFIESKGFGDNFGHGLGHGVGLEIHEAPVVGQNSDECLKAGMAVTIEPGIYVEDMGGVRIEDTVLVEKDGCQVLFGASKDFVNKNG